MGLGVEEGEVRRGVSNYMLALKVFDWGFLPYRYKLTYIFFLSSKVFTHFAQNGL